MASGRAAACACAPITERQTEDELRRLASALLGSTAPSTKAKTQTGRQKVNRQTDKHKSSTLLRANARLKSRSCARCRRHGRQRRHSPQIIALSAQVHARRGVCVNTLGRAAAPVPPLRGGVEKVMEEVVRPDCPVRIEPSLVVGVGVAGEAGRLDGDDVEGARDDGPAQQRVHALAQQSVVGRRQIAVEG
eukprot:6196826-Pleurochrysis_carterae.AAC.1